MSIGTASAGSMAAWAAEEPGKEEFVLKKEKGESPFEESGQREYLKAHTHAMNAIAEKIISAPKPSETSDIRTEKIEKFT